MRRPRGRRDRDRDRCGSVSCGRGAEGGPARRGGGGRGGGRRVLRGRPERARWGLRPSPVPQHFLQLEQIGGQLSASLLHSHDTETRATMTMALADDIIAAGQDASCHILRFSLQAPEAKSSSSGRNGEVPLSSGAGDDSVTAPALGAAGQGVGSWVVSGVLWRWGSALNRSPRPALDSWAQPAWRQGAVSGIHAVCSAAGSGEKGPRKRKGPSPTGQGDTQSQTSEVTVESLHSVRTDFSPDALQKAVRFNADCSLLVTGGADGFLRLWEVGVGGAKAGHPAVACIQQRRPGPSSVKLAAPAVL